ncbi:MAG: tetratricopeptide repeat protein [bacterium]|jgi:tetratricopeptide (TPR) repeat protein|nr:tetratricopeptide repeat protein [bacterium]
MKFKNLFTKFSSSLLSQGDHHAYKGFKAYENGDFQQAATEFNTSIEKGLTRYKLYEIYTALGNAYEDLALYEDAIAAHKKSLEIKPDFHKTWVNLGIVYRGIGDHEQAESSYNEAMKLKPDYAELQTSLGAHYIYKEKPEEAIKCLLKAKKLNPSIAITYGNLALAYAMVGKYIEAEHELKQAITLGYKNWRKVKERINDLREYEGAIERNELNKSAGCN